MWYMYHTFGCYFPFGCVVYFISFFRITTLRGYIIYNCPQTVFHTNKRGLVLFDESIHLAASSIDLEKALNIHGKACTLFSRSMKQMTSIKAKKSCLTILSLQGVSKHNSIMKWIIKNSTACLYYLENNRWFSAVLLCIYGDNHTRRVKYGTTRVWLSVDTQQNSWKPSIILIL